MRALRAGDLDRLITIERPVKTQSDSGEDVITWTEVATVWAEKVNLRGIERFASQQEIGHTITIFRIRYSTDVAETSTLHRLLFDGRYYDITDVREPKRREEIEIDCFAPSEQPVTP
jgi:SPP1 family predicted phage head-tail adaptor